MLSELEDDVRLRRIGLRLIDKSTVTFAFVCKTYFLLLIEVSILYSTIQMYIKELLLLFKVV